MEKWKEYYEGKNAKKKTVIAINTTPYEIDDEIEENKKKTLTRFRGR